jgi:hypothetical protein
MTATFYADGKTFEIFVAPSIEPPPIGALATLPPGQARKLPSWIGPGDMAARRVDFSGIALDAPNNRIILGPGGGHLGSVLTDLRVLDLATLQWSNMGPSVAVEDMIPENLRPRGEWVVDGVSAPICQHMYNMGVVVNGRYYLTGNEQVRLLDSPPSAIMPSTFWAPRVCWLDFASGLWQWSTNVEKIGAHYAGASADTLDGRILNVSPWADLHLYDPTADSVLSLGNLPGDPPGTSALVFFPPNGLFYALSPVGVWEIDFNAADPAASTRVKLTTTGPAPAMPYVSFGYDHVNARIGGCIQAGIYRAFDPLARTWTEETCFLEARSASTPDTVYHASTIEPSGCVIALDYEGNTWAYRPRTAVIVEPPPPATHSARVQMSDAPSGDLGNDGPNWDSANLVLRAPWKHPGGDWRDADDVEQGTHHYTSQAVPAHEVGDLVLDVTTLTQRLLDDNTGIYVTAVDVRLKPGALLHIETAGGNFDAPCIVDTYFNPSSGPQGNAPSLYSPAMFKFDLAGISGTVLHAGLTLHLDAVGADTTVTADYLDPPSLIAEGEIEYGIASDVDQDNALSTHAAVSEYHDLISTNYIAENFRAVAVDVPEEQRPDLVHNTDIIDWPQYGLKAARCWALTSNPRVISWRTKHRSEAEHLFCRYLMRIGGDLLEAMDEDGMKLPGLSGWGDYAEGQWNATLWHTPVSKANPHWYKLACYYMGADWNYAAHGARVIFTEGYLRAGKIHSIEQEILLNTIGAADGEMRIWLDGRVVLDERGMQMRSTAESKIWDNPFANVYHGGVKPPLTQFHVDIGGICVATEYIGPPVLIGP